MNRSTFDRDLERFLRKSRNSDDSHKQADAGRPRRRRAGAQNWLAALDIDFFKRVNDAYGHLYGDEVLLLFANLMRESFRDYDKLFRFGGEEFIVILCSTDCAGACTTFERFRRRVEDHTFPQVGKITVSIGVTEICGKVVPLEILEHADEALYYAKDNGRNQVCHYEGLIESGALASPVSGSHATNVELF